MESICPFFLGPLLFGRTPKWNLLTYWIRGFVKVKFVSSFLRDESGASAAEYALILAIVGTGIAVAAIALGGAISDSINDAADCIETPNATTCAS